MQTHNHFWHPWNEFRLCKSISWFWMSYTRKGPSKYFLVTIPRFKWYQKDTEWTKWIVALLVWFWMGRISLQDLALRKHAMRFWHPLDATTRTSPLGKCNRFPDTVVTSDWLVGELLMSAAHAFPQGFFPLGSHPCPILLNVNSCDWWGSRASSSGASGEYNASRPSVISISSMIQRHSPQNTAKVLYPPNIQSAQNSVPTTKNTSRHKRSVQ